MEKLEFITLCNNQRKLNKNKWIFLVEHIDNVKVEYKAFGTWVQLLRFNGIASASNMDISVKQYNEFLNNSLETV
jgi:hypothetical protein